MNIPCAVFFILVNIIILHVSADVFYNTYSKKVKLVVGGEERHFAYINSSEYDGVYEYFYEDGEAMDLSCSIIDRTNGLRLGYYDAQGTKLVETDILGDSVEPLNFRLLMRPEHDRAYVDCTYIPLDYIIGHKQEYTYRTVFRTQNSSSNFIITIDGVKLRSSPYNNAVYHHKFIYGETLNVTCEKRNKQLLHKILMGVAITTSMQKHANKSKEYVKTKVIEDSPAKYVFLIDTKYMDDGRFECSFGEYGSKDYVFAKVNLNGDSRDPTMHGLSPRDIIYEYSKNSNEWVTHYQYTVNETLPLTCLTIKQKTLRLFSEDDMLRDYTSNNVYGYRYINHTFTLNGNNITCEARDSHTSHRMVVLLHPKPLINYSNESYDRFILFLIIGCVVVVMFIAVTSICLYYWCKNNADTTKAKPYENYNEDNNPMPAVPNQWDENEYTYIQNENNYIDRSVILENDLYNASKKYNVSQIRITACSGHTENHYSEIDEYFIKNAPKNTNYSEPYDHIANFKKRQLNNEGYSNIQKETDNKSYGNVKEKNDPKTYCNTQEVDNANVSYVNNHN